MQIEERKIAVHVFQNNAERYVEITVSNFML